MNWFPIRNHSHYSLLLSTAKTEQIVSEAKDRGYESLCLTDYTTVAGIVSFVKQCNKAKIRPIIGCEIVVRSKSDHHHPTLTLICKNKQGWKTLLNIISKTNDGDNFEKKPTILYDDLLKFNLSNLICIDGYEGSLFHYSVTSDPKCSYFYYEYSDIAENCLYREWQANARKHTSKLFHIFGSNYYLTISPKHNDIIPLYQLLSNCVTDVAKEVGITNILIDNPVYYISRNDSLDHRVILASRLKCTLSLLDSKIENSEDFYLKKFINSAQFNMSIEPSDKEKKGVVGIYQQLLDSIEDFSILSNPILPNFPCPNGQTPIEYLRQLCRNGWKTKLSLTDEQKEIYKNRVVEELAVIEEANLASYFLIVQDYVNEFRNRGVLVGAGRGSAAGCLVSYLIGVTLIDPIPYDLLFSRFYNKGRNTKDHISLPDIDVDFPPEYREEVISYLKDKYGDDCVCQMVTFGRLQGRSVLKEVLRVNQYCSFEEMNTITSKIPPEASISDLLEEMDEPSVLMWTLQHDADALRDYCWLDEEGNLQGDYAAAFAQAMRLEGTFKSQGKHAAGVVIAAEPLSGICPMVKATRSNEKVAGMEMGDLEAISCVKMDILGVNLLTKVANTCKEI